MSSEYEVMFQTDGRHSSVYLYEPPMDVRHYVEPIDELLSLGIDTICYVVGDCSVLLYDTKVGERWGHNVDLTDHAVWHRASKNVASFIERGMDPLMVVCEHAQRRGFKFLPHLILNLTHTAHGRVTNSRVADFTSEHPEWQIGPEPDFPEAKFDHPNQLSYAVPEVRANRLAVIRELVSDYPTDGIEANFYDPAPFLARREVAEHTQTMTDWVGEDQVGVPNGGSRPKSRKAHRRSCRSHARCQSSDGDGYRRLDSRGTHRHHHRDAGRWRLPERHIGPARDRNCRPGDRGQGLVRAGERRVRADPRGPPSSRGQCLRRRRPGRLVPASLSCPKPLPLRRGDAG